MATKTKTLEVKLVKSLIGSTKKQIDTAHALGLRKMNSTNTIPENASSLGMIEVVKHLIEVKEVK
jgi:large subunit ribosomal protein L30